MDDSDYNIKQVESFHVENLQLAFNKYYASHEKDLSIVTEDGEQIETWKSLLCLYSSSFGNYVNDVPCCTSTTSISLPVSSIALNNLINLLLNGVAKINANGEMEEVTEAAKVLEIDLENILIDLEDFDSESIETDLDDAYNIKVESETNEFESSHNVLDLADSGLNESYKTNVKSELEEENIDFNQEVIVEDVISKKGYVVGSISKDKKSSIHFKVNKKKPTCNQCGKGFLDSLKLKRHMAAHSGEKPIALNQCTESFSRKDKLKIHGVKEHKSGSQIKCDLCPARYPDASFLDEHLKAHQQADELMQELM